MARKVSGSIFLISNADCARHRYIRAADDTDDADQSLTQSNLPMPRRPKHIRRILPAPPARACNQLSAVSSSASACGRMSTIRLACTSTSTRSRPTIRYCSSGGSARQHRENRREHRRARRPRERAVHPQAQAARGDAVVLFGRADVGRRQAVRSQRAGNAIAKGALHGRVEHVSLLCLGPCRPNRAGHRLDGAPERLGIGVDFNRRQLPFESSMHEGVGVSLALKRHDPVRVGLPRLGGHARAETQGSQGDDQGSVSKVASA